MLPRWPVKKYFNVEKFMKKVPLLFLGVLLSLNAFASGVTNCTGVSSKSGSLLTVKASFNALSKTELRDVRVSVTETDGAVVAGGAAESSVGSAWKNRSPLYNGMNRFQVTSSGWTNINLIFPSSGSFKTGYVQMVGHDTMPAIKMICEQN